MAAANNRAKLIGKLQTALKKHYKPTATASRPLLEHILYASLLQDAPYELADEGMAKCEQEFFDWNEVRVTTVTELAQVLANLPEPSKSAARLKGNLQDIFEEFYSFDIDHLKKDNLGKAVAKFERMPTMTPFVLAYATQHGLGGHSIPIDYASLVVMLSTGIVTQNEAASGKVPGLERAIPKTKALEFSSLLHQCGVDLLINPKDKPARAVLDATAAGSSKQFDKWQAGKSAAIERLRKRKSDEKKSEAVAPKEEVEVKSGKKSKAPTEPTKPKMADKKTSKLAKKTALEKPTSKTTDEKPSVKKTGSAKKESDTVSTKEAADKKKASKKTASVKKAAAKKSPAKKSPSKKASAEKAPAKKATKKTEKTTAASKKTAKKKADSVKTSTPKAATKKKSVKKSDNRKLTKRKPR